MTSTNTTHYKLTALYAPIASQVVAATLLAGMIIATGCAEKADTAADSPPPIGATTAAGGAGAPQLTATENKAKAMSVIDSNPNMSPEQKAAMKKQLEAKSAKP